MSWLQVCDIGGYSITFFIATRRPSIKSRCSQHAQRVARRVPTEDAAGGSGAIESGRRLEAGHSGAVVSAVTPKFFGDTRESVRVANCTSWFVRGTWQGIQKQFRVASREQSLHEVS